MRRIRRKSLFGIAALFVGAGVHASADATLQDSTGAFKGGIRSDVNTSSHFNPGDYIQSFQRASDLFSPLVNESYGFSLTKEATATLPRSAGLGGYASNYIGTSNINVRNEDFTSPNSAKVSVNVTEPSTPGKPLLQVDQTYSFAADNVLRILTTITNVNRDNAKLSDILFRRNANMNLGADETVDISGSASKVTNSSTFGAQSPNPTDQNQDPDPMHPTQSGGSFTLSLDDLAAGKSESFYVYEAITRINAITGAHQSASDLSGEVERLGGKFLITGNGITGSDKNGNVSDGEVLAFGGITAIPEASTLLSFGALAGLGGLMLKRRAKKQS